jgi:hypothetical protein
MKIRIVCYEDPNFWILGKFAINLEKNLIILGHDVEINNVPNPDADINHHIIFNDYNGIKSSIDTLMITHVDNIDKLSNLKKNINIAAVGICMSLETMNWLQDLGIRSDKLAYINPAHDCRVNIKKIIIGIFCRVQTDGRKREYFLDKLCKSIDPNIFKFIIMGDSWEPQVENLKFHNFDVEYFPNFIAQKYVELIPLLDYYLYMGMDEGQMGVLDAHAAGVSTIVTAQGYHLDLSESITFSFKTYDELLNILLKLQFEKKKLIESVSNLTWMDYTLKHIEIWKFLIEGKKFKSKYKDGVNSIFGLNTKNFNSNNTYLIYFLLIKNKYVQKFYFFKQKFKKLSE